MEEARYKRHCQMIQSNSASAAPVESQTTPNYLVHVTGELLNGEPQKIDFGPSFIEELTKQGLTIREWVTQRY